MNIPSTEEIARSFSKQDLIAITIELSLRVDPGLHIWKMIEAILSDLDESGVPLDDDLSDELFDFLVYAKYITDDGTLIEIVEGEGEDEVEELEETEKEIEDLPEDLPECFGWGDPEDDRNCARCPIVDACVTERDKTIADMACFGVLYDEKSPDCTDCTIWRLCQAKMEDK